MLFNMSYSSSFFQTLQSVHPSIHPSIYPFIYPSNIYNALHTSESLFLLNHHWSCPSPSPSCLDNCNHLLPGLPASHHPPCNLVSRCTQRGLLNHEIDHVSPCPNLATAPMPTGPSPAPQVAYSGLHAFITASFSLWSHAGFLSTT